MSLVTVSGLSKGFGPQTVFENVSIRVARGEKIGIVGKNGGGKTTFLKMLIGREDPDKGTVSVAKGVRVGYLSQIAELDDARTVKQEAETALSALFDVEAELRETEQLLAQNPHDADALDAYQAARDRWDFAGGDQAEGNLHAAMTALGFKPADWEKPVGVLSGGEKTRLAMAKLLASAPDVLALDEPTNHLDIGAVEWLEGFLNRFPGAVLVVSHDRRLLQNVSQTIWEVENHNITDYSNGYAGYKLQRDANRARQQEEYERQSAEIARIEEYIRRNKAGQNARNAAGRAKQLTHIERIERPVSEPGAMKAKIQTGGRAGREVVVCERASKRYDDKVLLNNATFNIERDQRVGIVGPNGVGKTTFIEMVLGEESPDSGYIRRGHGVTVAYHKQEADDFDPDESVLENFYERAGMSVGEARGHLAKYLFTGEDIYKPVSALSGGERAKLAMALMVLSPANLLILDEPTNHLDVYSCDALAESLQAYQGTLLLVSHDRSLLDAVTDHTLALEGGGKVVEFEGNYAAYRASKEAAQPSQNGASRNALPAKKSIAEAVTNNGVQTGQNLSARELSKERQRVAKRVAQLEADVEKLETRLSEIEADLSSPQSADAALALSHDYARVKDDLTARMNEWEAATLEAEAVGASV